MEKTNSSREGSTWGTLDRNILAIVFDKLDTMDITMGASRVCIYWFLVSHNKTLWHTIDLTKLKHKGQNVLYKYRADNDVEEVLSFSNLSTKMSRFFFNFCGVKGINLKNLLGEITKLSGTAPRNVFFNFFSYLQKQDLMFAVGRMPNIEKLALPFSWSLFNEVETFRFAFNQWKNLKTLILAQNGFYTWFSFEIRVVGKNCINLNNLKLVGYLGNNNYAEEIVCYFQSLTRLSLRCSMINVEGVLMLIRGLRNLAVLNLTHCVDLGGYPFIKKLRKATNNQKLDKLVITCSENECKVCKDRPGVFREHVFYEKHWRNDEIKELEF
ncbi:hypothetical protein CARUB_v10002502mg [Capsella rubella]|uniref:F-box domain-containing protein n=1 Tax=Capsella rubella TaxID=81985 RepID=R0FI15_9BRAS|nr:putative F-box protein At4g11580 [Capsella rubella]EOA21992.1 hypothetical protein CARUB_v10002502mg [Capsella rubella]